MEAEIGRWHELVVKFREFQEVKARNKGPRAEMLVWRNSTEVGMAVSFHLGGRLVHIMVAMGIWGWGK
jgi:hypothetical protein